MNIQTRLDAIAKKLPPKAKRPNPFASMTTDELRQISRGVAELTQAEIDKDPNAVNTIDPRLLKHLESEGLI
jgi:hypothetical protein